MLTMFTSVPLYLGCLCLCLWLSQRQRWGLDRVAAQNTLYEQVLREKKLKPHEIGLVTFGYVGWRLEPYFRQHEGRNSLDLAGCLQCVGGWTDKGGLAMITQLPKPLSRYKKWFSTHNNAMLAKSKTATKLATITAPVLWFYEATFTLQSTPLAAPPVGKIPINYADYQDHPFPLNDREWRALIEKGEAGQVAP